MVLIRQESYYRTKRNFKPDPAPGNGSVQLYHHHTVLHCNDTKSKLLTSMSKDIYTGVEGEMNSCRRFAISDPIILIINRIHRCYHTYGIFEPKSVYLC